MTDRHARDFKPALRPDKALYQRVAAKVRATGATMNDTFEAWLRWMDGQEDEHPPRPPGGGEPRP